MKKTGIRLLIVAAVIFIVYNFINMVSAPQETIIADIEQIEMTYTFDGIITRDETVVTTSQVGISTLGVLDPTVQEGEMVAKGRLVALHYDSSIDDETKRRLADINRRIAEIESAPDQMNAMEIDEDKINDQIDKQLELLTDASKRRDMRQIAHITSENID